MVRQLLPDVIRYGTGPKDDYSHLGESIFDHPFQWGSKRTGPDLAREGPKRDYLWHVIHMRDPRALDKNSTMPNYPWLFDKKFDIESLPGKIAAQRRLGVPYPAMTTAEIQDSAKAQAISIHNILKGQQTWVDPDREIIALIAYLKKLGTWHEVKPGSAPAGDPGRGEPPGLKFDNPDNYRRVTTTQNP